MGLGWQRLVLSLILSLAVLLALGMLPRPW